jgi:hypothetical protein
MQKTLTALLIVMTGFLVIGSWLFPDSSMLWLADTSAGMNAIRILLIALLSGLLFTNPPRKIHFRYVLGGSAALLGLLTLGQTYNNTMQVLDALVYIQAAVLFALAALEQDPLAIPEAHATSTT